MGKYMYDVRACSHPVKLQKVEVKVQTFESLFV